jgi:hypothetical protein
MKALVIGTAAMLAFAFLPNCSKAEEAPGFKAEEGAHTVQMLYQESNDDDSNRGVITRLICIGYVGGVGDHMSLIGEARDKRPDLRQVLHALSICGKPTYGSMIQAFTNWAEKHPECSGATPQRGGSRAHSTKRGRVRNDQSFDCLRHACGHALAMKGRDTRLYTDGVSKRFEEIWD